MGLAAGRLAVRLVNHLVEREPGFDFEAELERFILRAERTAFGPSTQAIVDEAVARDIPWLRLNEHSLVQLGQGVYQQRIRATMTSRTSSLAVDVAGDKELTNQAAGRRRPARAPVLSGARRRRRAWPRPGASASRWWSSRWTATTAAASTSTCAPRTRWRAAFPDAAGRGHGGARSLVETYVAGNDYRVLVVDGRMVAIAERVPAHVVGDGRPRPWPSWSSRPTPTPAGASATRRC